MGFYHIMGVGTILVMGPGCCEQTFVPPTQRGSILNLASIGQAVSEMFEIVDAGAWVSYKLTYEPSAQVS